MADENMRAPRYEPPSLKVLMRALELMAQSGTLRLTIELSARQAEDAADSEPERA